MKYLIPFLIILIAIIIIKNVMINKEGYSTVSYEHNLPSNKWRGIQYPYVPNYLPVNTYYYGRYPYYLSRFNRLHYVNPYRRFRYRYL